MDNARHTPREKLDHAVSKETARHIHASQLCALILFIQTLALYKSFTYLLTYLYHTNVHQHQRSVTQRYDKRKKNN